MKKGPLIAFLDNSLQKLEFTAWFAVNVTFGSKNNVFYHWWPHCAPTPLGLIGLRYKLSAHMQKFRLLFRKLSESLTFQNLLKFKFCLQLSDLKLFGPRILFWTHILFSPKLSLDRNLFLTLIFNKLFVLLYIFDNFYAST